MRRIPKSPHKAAQARKRRRVVLAPKEAAEQELLAAWLIFRRVLFCHPPNGEWRHWSVAKRLKAAGVMPGVPDILIFTRPPQNTAARGVAIELKRIGVRHCSAEQAQWLQALEEEGWLTKIAAGAREAIEWLVLLGY